MASRYLRDQVVFYPLATGLDSGREAMIAQEGTVLMENLEHKRRGALSKREGTTVVDTTSNDIIATYKDRPVTLGSSGLEVYDGSTATNGDFDAAVTSPDEYFGVTFEGFGGIQNNKIRNPSYVQVGDFNVIAYNNWSDKESSGELLLKVFHKESGRLIDSQTLNSSVPFEKHNARCIVDGGGICYVFYPKVTTYLMGFVEINTTTGAISAEYSVTNLTAPVSELNRLIDVCTFGTSDADIFICHRSGAGGENQAIIATFTGSGGGSHSSSFETITITGVTQVGCCQLDEEAVFIYHDGTDVKAHGRDSSLDSTISEATIYATVAYCYALGGVAVSATQADIYATILVSGEGFSTGINSYTNSSGTGSAGSSEQIHIMIPWSKPVRANSNTYMIMESHDDMDMVDNVTNRSHFLFRNKAGGRLTATTPVSFGKAFVSRVSNTFLSIDVLNYLQYALTEVDTTSGFTFLSAFMGSDQTDGIAKVNFSTIDPEAIEGESNLIIPSAMPMEFDGRNVFEQGFNYIPKIAATAAEGSGTNLNDGNEYSWKVTYECRDDNGNRWVSASSPAVSLTVDTEADDAYNIAAPQMVGSWRSNIKVVFYRTEGNGPSAKCHRIGERDNTSDATGGLVLFTDNIADSTITSNEVIYTNGGVEKNIQPPPTKIHTIYQNRHFCVDAERPKTRIRYTKAFQRYVGTQHSDSLFVDVTTDDGDIVALKEMDDKLVIFKENSIYATYGSSLENEGVLTGSGYATPLLISNAKGCTNKETIVRVPNGLIFQGHGGIYLLNRDWSVDLLFSAKVQYQFETYAISSLVKAVHFPLKSQVFFFSSGSDEVALVYDYKYEQWTTYTNFKASSATAAQDTLYFIDPDEGVRAIDITTSLTSTNYKDGSNFVTAKLDTGWLSFSGVLGFQRVRELYVVGYNLLDHDFNVRVGYDFDPKLASARVYESEDLDNFGMSQYFSHVTASSWDQQAYLIRCVLPKQKCSSIRICIDDTVDDTGAGTPTFEIVGIAFVVAAKRGPHRIEANRIVP